MGTGSAFLIPSPGPPPDLGRPDTLAGFMKPFVTLLGIALLGPALLGSAGCRMEPPPRPIPPPAVSSRFANGTNPEAAHAIRGLLASDFATRCRAAEVLVALGEEALPALEEAGELPDVAHGRIAVSAASPVVAEILSTQSIDRLLALRSASAPSVLAKAAAVELARRGDRSERETLVAKNAR